MYLRKLLLGSFIFLCVINLNAQRDLFSGFIVDNNHDTIYGQIFSRGSYLNGRQCEFKYLVDSPSQTFSPGEILEYHFDFGIQYVYDSVLIGNTYRHVFLEYVVNGTADLYYLKDDFGYSYFIRKEDGTELSLITTEIHTENNPQYHSIETIYPTGELKSYFSEAEEIHRQIDKSTLTHESMISIVTNYHDLVCPGEACDIYIEEKPKSVFIISPMVGLRYAQLENEYFNVLGTILEFESTGLVYGLNVGYNIHAVSKKSFLLLKAAFGNDYFYKRLDYQTELSETYYYFHLNSYFADISFLFDQAFGQGKVMPSIGAGPSFYFDMHSESKVISENYNGLLVLTKELEMFNYPAMQTGFTVQIGARIKMNNGDILAITGSRASYFQTVRSYGNKLHSNNFTISWYF